MTKDGETTREGTGLVSFTRVFATSVHLLVPFPRPFVSFPPHLATLMLPSHPISLGSFRSFSLRSLPLLSPLDLGCECKVRGSGAVHVSLRSSHLRPFGPLFVSRSAPRAAPLPPAARSERNEVSE